MASPLVAPPVAQAKTLLCPNCGGPVERRGFGYTLTVVCPQCLTVLDASTPLLSILQKMEAAQRRTPIIPLGSRGDFAGATWELIGFQTRGTAYDGEVFEWHEYLLFNPYKGFRYLVQYDGHWNFVVPLESMPEPQRMGRPAAVYEGRLYKHFSKADAATSFVLGEFPWRVRVGDTVTANDFISPPFILSSEATQEEVTWSKGEYTSGSVIWKAFRLPGSPPPVRGTYLNQPSPYEGNIGGIWRAYGLMIFLTIALAIAFAILTKKEVVVNESHAFSTLDKGEPSYVTKTFELTGRTAPLELNVESNLNQDWAYFNFALVNEDSGEAFDFGREVSFYSGTDSDGDWSEGDRTTSVYVPAVPPGKYYLRVEPEMDNDGRTHSMSYSLTLRHDVPYYTWFWIAALLLLLPPIAYTLRARSFETRRWADSDYAGKGA